MQRRLALPPAVLAALCLLVAASCGDDGGGAGGGATAGGGGEGDGKFRPAPNGVPIAEATACARVESAFQTRMTDLGCAGTARSCPDLVKAPSGAPACAQYDEGAADGCATHVSEGSDCEDVRSRLDACIVAFIEGSEPTGCP